MTDEAVEQTADVETDDDLEFDRAFEEFAGAAGAAREERSGSHRAEDPGDRAESHEEAADATSAAAEGAPADPWAEAPAHLRALFQQQKRETETWMHRAKSDAGRVTALQGQVSTLRQQGGPHKPTGQTAQVAGADLANVPESLKQSFSEAELTGLSEWVDRRARELIQPLGQSVEHLHQRTAEQSRRQYLADFSAKLDEAFREDGVDWRAINQDPGFMQWLEQPDPVYGVPRRARFAADRDTPGFQGVVGVADYYRQFAQQVAGARAEGSGAGVQQQQASGRNGRLRRAVTTETRRPGAADVPPNDDFDAAWDYYARRDALKRR